MCSSIKNSKWLKWSCIIILILLVLLLPMIWWSDWFYNEIIQGKNATEIKVWHYIALVIVTGILAYIAWNELNKLEKINTSELLIKLERIRLSKNIRKARLILWKLSCESKSQSNKLTEQEQKKWIGEQIVNYYNNGYDDFLYLRDHLDFLENIGNLCDKEMIEKKYVKDLWGITLKSYYDVYKPLIKMYQDKSEDSGLYEHFISLCEEIAREKKVTK